MTVNCILVTKNSFLNRISFLFSSFLNRILTVLDFKTTEFQEASQTATEQGKAELCILNFKTTQSEFQKSSQTATKQGNAEPRILDFKTTQSEFQKPSQAAAT